MPKISFKNYIFQEVIAETLNDFLSVWFLAVKMSVLFARLC